MAEHWEVIFASVFISTIAPVVLRMVWASIVMIGFMAEHIKRR